VKERSLFEEFAAALGPVFVAARGAKPTSTSAAFDQTLVAQCDFAWARCRQVRRACHCFFAPLASWCACGVPWLTARGRQHDDVSTWVPSNPLNRSGITYAGPTPTVRLAEQPFLVAGDTYLYRQNGRITVARLTTAGSSEYLVARDRLQIDSNVHTQDIADCEVRAGEQADACYNAAARENKVVLPTGYRFWDSEYSTVAASEWGVHWADVSELSVLTGTWEICGATGRLAVQITSAYGTCAAGAAVLRCCGAAVMRGLTGERAS